MYWNIVSMSARCRKTVVGFALVEPLGDVVLPAALAHEVVPDLDLLLVGLPPGLPRPLQEFFVRGVGRRDHMIHERLVRNAQEMHAAFVEPLAQGGEPIGRQFARVVQSGFCQSCGRNDTGRPPDRRGCGDRGSWCSYPESRKRAPESKGRPSGRIGQNLPRTDDDQSPPANFCHPERSAAESKDLPAAGRQCRHLNNALF